MNLFDNLDILYPDKDMAEEQIKMIERKYIQRQMKKGKLKEIEKAEILEDNFWILATIHNEQEAIAYMLERGVKLPKNLKNPNTIKKALEYTIIHPIQFTCNKNK